MVVAMPAETNRPRRLFLGSSMALAGSLTLAGCAGMPKTEARGNGPIQAGDVVLFQGDSITDAGRDRKATEPNQHKTLGRGYAWFAAAAMLASRPEDGLQIHNKGISGNKVHQLADRWQRDCLDLAPDVLSILIGVNDIWHKLNGRYDGTVGTYEEGFDALLKRTRAKLPNVTLVVCEPFVLRCGAVNDKWFPEFDHRRQAARRVAEQHKAIWVPFQTMFDDAVAEGTEPKYWAGDGVHPSLAGHALMAATWRKNVGI